MDMFNYQEGRNLIKDGDIVFVSGNPKRPIQALIMFVTNSKYSHVGIAFWATINNRKRLFIVESQGGTKTRIINMSFYDGRELDVIIPPLSWDEVYDIALKDIGIKQYGWLDAIYIGLREVLQKYVRLPSKKFPGEICSERVARIYKLENTGISPQKLYEELTEDLENIRLKIG